MSFGRPGACGKWWATTSALPAQSSVTRLAAAASAGARLPSGTTKPSNGSFSMRRYPAAVIVETMSSASLWMPTRLSAPTRSEEHTSELQSLMRISYAVFCLQQKTHSNKLNITNEDKFSIHTLCNLTIYILLLHYKHHMYRDNN